MRHRTALATTLCLLVGAPAAWSSISPRGHDASARAAGYWCGSTVARGYRFPVRVERGRASCHTARWILRWWLRGPHTQQHKGWWCFDDHGRALERGGVAHCSKTRHGRLRALVRAYSPR